jgi:transposase
MKDGRTHLAYKAEHAVDLETGALVAVTLQDADQGDTTTIIEKVVAAAEQSEDAQAEIPAPELLTELIADKGYHSNQTMIDLAAVGPAVLRGGAGPCRRDWSEEPPGPFRPIVHQQQHPRIRDAVGEQIEQRLGFVSR